MLSGGKSQRANYCRWTHRGKIGPLASASRLRLAARWRNAQVRAAGSSRSQGSAVSIIVTTSPPESPPRSTLREIEDDRRAGVRLPTRRNALCRCRLSPDEGLPNTKCAGVTTSCAPDNQGRRNLAPNAVLRIHRFSSCGDHPCQTANNTPKSEADRVQT